MRSADWQQRLVFAALGSYGRTSALEYQASSGGGPGSTYAGTLRLGWAFDPALQAMIEGRLGLTDWSCCSGSHAARSVAARVQSNFFRTAPADLYLALGVGLRKDDAPSGGFNGPCGFQESNPTGQCQWKGEARLGAGLELHLARALHLAFETDYNLAGPGTGLGFHIGVVLR
jgi:hypothetical protein